MMNFNQKKIGIWGYGIVGASAANFLARHGASIVVYDDRPLSCPYPVVSKDTLLHHTDFLLASPGVDSTAVRSSYTGTWLNELDLFQAYCHTPVIAITGSIGKTSVVEGLTYTLQHAGFSVIAAGNIGLPMLDVIDTQDSYDYIILEVSSFQLEYCNSFAPQLAIWTNLYPNHLDRHPTLQSYSDAKANIIRHQHAGQKALIAADLYNQLPLTASDIFYVAMHETNLNHCFFIKDHQVMLSESSSNQFVAHENNITAPFALNALIITSALYLCNIAIPTIALPALEHRLEKVATLNGVTFYNDSKSTTPQSTLAAVATLPKDQPFALFLGGLSKGIDRAPLIQALKNLPVTVYCFGKEAPSLAALCATHAIAHYNHPTLDESFHECINHLKNYTSVLLSPAGSSYDLFLHYKQRGTHFKTLVSQLKK